MNEFIDITDKAKEQIKVIATAEGLKPDHGLRVAVVGGGCSGLSYKIEFSPKKEKDFSWFVGEIPIIIDPKSAIYLKGITLDFQDGLNGKGFVFQNPNAKNTCGCGESFSV
jgi:iron-sulfur cluster assembly protein